MMVTGDIICDTSVEESNFVHYIYHIMKLGHQKEARAFSIKISKYIYCISFQASENVEGSLNGALFK